ncbi:PREDICTED: KAT8 regulatory NSL complex subunit 1-like protein isoform X1 [Poecilia mexicana]|uniref:KAT8 regulatory NSL complex subunit 1-like protein isoform X1 n=1 Tax=Poecilia mexicana TaxID=48701 RepID=UPI00072DEEA1|nr:PREDICTED: KAT8 regulatory NSL complex subunit 1-like protein isoform X1 [Poecilia mexicana]
MAPALTKILKNDHGIHLSSPPASVAVDSDASAILCTVELEPHLRPADDGDLQKISLNLCSLGYLDPVDPPANPSPFACGPACHGQGEMVARPAPGLLVSLPCFSKCQRESRQVATVFPGATDMFLIPLPEHNSQEALLLHGQSVQPECGPDGGDVLHSSLIFPSVCPSYSHGEQASQNLTSMYATQPKMMYEELEKLCPPPTAALRQFGTGFVNPERLESRNPLENAAKEQLSRHAELQGRACRLQRRLQALLGEHALKHCSQQLEGLKKHFQLEDVPPDGLDSATPPQSCSNPCFPWEESIAASAFFAEVADFCESNQMVLRGLQEALDSEATGSSSSDDELEEDMLSPFSSSSSSEMQWLEERAELSSRWIWLQLRMSELDGRIEQLVELHKHIRSTKGRVVLAQSQPLTDRQIQQTLMREMAGLSCTASDADAEPCSPTRLLYNIERQSAQLSQIVNSLMLPLSFSPLSKQSSKERGTFTSTPGGDDVFLTGSAKGRRLKGRRLFRVDASCVCARTRPMVSCHKRRLFSVTSCYTTSSPKSRKPVSTHFPTCNSCDSVCLCSKPGCSCRSRLHPLVPLSSGVTTSHHFQQFKAREEWVQRPLIINSRLSNPPNYGRVSSTPRHKSRKCKQHVRRQKRGVLTLSPIRSPGSAWSQRRRSNKRKRKRGRRCRLTKDDQDVLYQLCDLGDSSNDMLEENYGQFTLSRGSRGFLRKHHRGRVYNIDDIVIPVIPPLSKVEKLQYKDILTPRWRVVDIQGLTPKLGEENQKIEDLCDEIFARRHQALEQKEKRRWTSWEKRKCWRRSTRSGSRLSSSGGGMCTSGDESSVEWGCAQLDSDEQPRVEEWLPQAPWESRVFPLDEREEATLLSDEVKIPSGWTESSCLSFSSKPSNSQLSPTQSACTTLPPCGQIKSCASSGS